MEERNAREKQRENHVRDGMPACRGIEEEHEGPKSVGGRHAPGGDIEDPQPPRHLLGIALGAETDAGKQAHAAVSPRMERYKDRHKAWSSKPLGRHQPIRQIRNASLSAKSPRPAPLRRVTTIATVFKLELAPEVCAACGGALRTGRSGLPATRAASGRNVPLDGASFVRGRFSPLFRG